jgi:hypothetical protein
VQQDLAAPGVVERFMGQQQGAELRQLFAGECSEVKRLIRRLHAAHSCSSTYALTLLQG